MRARDVKVGYQYWSKHLGVIKIVSVEGSTITAQRRRLKLVKRKRDSNFSMSSWSDMDNVIRHYKTDWAKPVIVPGRDIKRVKP